MTYLRDPLSVELDPVAEELVTRAITRYRRKQKNASITAWTRGVVQNRLSDVIRDAGPDRLSKAERALQRALYYDSRIYQLTARKKPDARWSLLIDWDPAPLIPGRPRTFRLQVFRDSQAARHVKGEYRKRDKWTENPALQSGGIGSGRERF